MERAELRNHLQSRYTIEELKNICFDARIAYEQFPTDKMPSFVRELVLYCERNNCYEWLVDLCSENRDSSPGPISTAKLRDHDFAVLSECHGALVKMRNLIKNTLGIVHLERGINESIAQLSKQALENSPVLQRTMGPKWLEEHTNTVIQAVILTRKMSGRDYQAEASNLKNQPRVEVVAFFAESQAKTQLIERLDELIMRLESKLT